MLYFYCHPRKGLMIIEQTMGLVEVQLYPHHQLSEPQPLMTYQWKGPASAFYGRAQWCFGLPRSAPGTARILIPHWFTAFSCAAIGSAPWLRWRFSLRALLIATTRIAIVLGLIAWLR
jgi:hypothetical protein